MNTGYISSDFMEIRQHLAHYGVKGMKWSKYKHRTFYREGKDGKLEQYEPKVDPDDGHGLLGSIKTSYKGDGYTAYHPKGMYGSKAGIPSNLDAEEENIKNASDKSKENLKKLRKKKADSLRAYNAERYRVGR